MSKDLTKMHKKEEKKEQEAEGESSKELIIFQHSLTYIYLIQRIKFEQLRKKFICRNSRKFFLIIINTKYYLIIFIFEFWLIIFKKFNVNITNYYIKLSLRYFLLKVKAN